MGIRGERTRMAGGGKSEPLGAWGMGRVGEMRGTLVDQIS